MSLCADRGADGGVGWSASSRLLFGHDAVKYLARLHTAGVDIELEQAAIRVVQQVLLLALQHFKVFAKNLSLAFADGGGQRLVLGVELARHAPEVPDRDFSLGGNEVHHH